MSTRSSIAIINPDGKVKSVYCHFDGYPEGVGATLVQFHNTEEAARHIIELGDISVLGEKLDPEPTQEHTFDERQKGVTVAYSRDRGEDAENIKAKDWECFNDWFEMAPDVYWADYCYWWKDGKWHCQSPYDEKETDLYA